MSLLGSLGGALTSGIDLFVGGQLEKAYLEVDKDDSRAANKGKKLEFQFNPETIKVNRVQARTSTATQGLDTKKEDQNAAPQQDSTLVISNVIFDTYETKPFDSVYDKYIKMLEMMGGYDQGKHAPAVLVFHWGKFSEAHKGNSKLKCKLDGFNVEYTMFLNDGTPVRAKCDLTLRLGLSGKEQQANSSTTSLSPDHAKLVTVKRGSTLADIAAAEYENPAEWRRIAAANNIDDPLSLIPGTKLIVPPILS